MRPLALVRESFRFYRLQSQTLVRVLFLCSYAMSILRSVFPSDAENLAEIYKYLMSSPYSGLGLASGQTGMPAVSQATMIWVGVQLVSSLFLLLFAFAYASFYVAEHEGDTVRVGVVKYLKSLPRLMAFFFMFFGISFLSSAMTSTLILLFLLIGGTLTLYFLPLLLSRTSMKMMWAVNRSFSHTRGHRFYIFNCLLLVTFLIGIIRNLFLMFLPADIWVDGILGGFFSAVMTMMHGRLMGGLYFIVFKQQETLPGMPAKEPEESGD